MKIPSASDYEPLYQMFLAHAKKYPASRFLPDEDTCIVLKMFKEEFAEWLGHIKEDFTTTYDCILEYVLEGGYNKEGYHSSDVVRIAEILWLAVNEHMFYEENPLRAHIKQMERERKLYGF